MRRKIPASHTLLCFEAAARHLSFTRAAQELALTQSAVSRQVSALEDYLGRILFERGRHGVTLTAAGQIYAARVSRQLAEIERDTREIMTGHQRQSDLRLACVATFATEWLIPRLPDLRQRHPHLTVHIETRTRPFLLADSGIDAAIFAGTQEQVTRWAGTQHILLHNEEVVPVCSPRLLGKRKALTPKMIATLPLIQQSTRPDAWSDWFNAMEILNVDAHVGARFELFSMSCAAAANGMGIALVPRLLVEDQLKRKTLVIAHPKSLPSERHYFFIYPEGQDLPPVVTQFRDWLQTIQITPVTNAYQKS